MTRWLLPVAAGLALGVAALLTVMAVAGAGERTPSQRVDALAAELRCPDCQGLSVGDSPTRSAQEIRRQIDELVTAGATDDQVRAHFTARYGEWILLAPRAPLLWIVPFVAVLGGLAALIWWIVTRRSIAPEPAPMNEPVDADERRRLHDEAEALDA
ncbi:MAG TPA: cytochrome c-type biogenesis protein [Candidatus Angelobacter sp.]|nr:cytochrome c-type biogenesis protein [Candidatus Angelobacter sp.]